MKNFIVNFIHKILKNKKIGKEIERHKHAPIKNKMGRRSISSTKSGKFMNTTDQASKEIRPLNL
jgi:hypothetical protein